jgi:thiamine-monophosphate kinase
MAPFERDFLNWLAKSDVHHERVTVPLGDDGAVLRISPTQSLVLAADLVAEGRHFLPDAKRFLIGRKALARNLSDLAAMGARPLAALATCALPRGESLDGAAEITQGLRSLGAEWDCPLIGGDTSTHDGGLVLSVTVIGELFGQAPVLRSGAIPGDAIFVTGALGGAWRSDRHFKFQPRLKESERLSQLGSPSAMIDLSDGLLMDLHRLADASGVGFQLDCSEIPIHEDSLLSQALTDGEDYELLFTWPADRLDKLENGWSLATRLHRIGFIKEHERTLVSDQGIEAAPRTGFEHD